MPIDGKYHVGRRSIATLPASAVSQAWLRRAPTIAVLAILAWPAARMQGATNQVALFTGFGALPNAGMDVLNAALAASEIPDYEGQVFQWTQQQEAFDWIGGLASERSTLVLIGHSFGGNSALQLAGNFLLPDGIQVDLTIQIDSVSNTGAGPNDQLPANVDVGLNYYQQSTGFFEPQGEDAVQGAANFNVETLFNDVTITHTSIDNDPRLHALVTQNIIDNLNRATADFDEDGAIGGLDFLTWQASFPVNAGATRNAGDADADGDVDPDDLAVWQLQFGSAAASAQRVANAVPEPSAWSLVICVAAFRVMSNRQSRRWLDARRGGLLGRL